MKKTISMLVTALALTGLSLFTIAADSPPAGEGPGHQDAGSPYGPPGFAGEPGKKADTETLTTETDAAPKKDEKTDPDWEHGNPPHGTADPGEPGSGPGWAKEKGQ